MATTTDRRVLITGVGPISPLGMTSDVVYDSLVAGRSGVTPLTDIQPESFPFCFGGQVTEFNGNIEDFGPLEKEQKKGIRKGLKLMCREIQLAVAAAQRALADAALHDGKITTTQLGGMCSILVGFVAMACMSDGGAPPATTELKQSAA